MKLDFFDCNCCFGVLPVRIFRFSRDAEELREEMEFCNIGRALVYHAAMHSFGSPIEGNELLLQEIAGRSELYPTRAILPPQTGEQPEPEALVADIPEEKKEIPAMPPMPQY